MAATARIAFLALCGLISACKPEASSRRRLCTVQAFGKPCDLVTGQKWFSMVFANDRSLWVVRNDKGENTDTEVRMKWFGTAWYGISQADGCSPSLVRIWPCNDGRGDLCYDFDRNVNLDGDYGRCMNPEAK